MNVVDRFRLNGKSSLVTGAGQGIGRSYAIALAEAGSDVAIVDKDLDKAISISNEISNIGRRSIGIEADITNPKDTEHMVEIVVSEWGKLDIGVNNVGGSSPMKAVDYTEESWDTAMDLNLKSILLSAQAEAKVMLPLKYGNIVNTASMSGLIVNKGRPTAGYNTAKAGVIHLTRCLAAEWASDGIRVNSISPGYMNTPAIQLPHLGEFHKTWAEETPIGRLGEVEDVQGALLYLVSNASSFVTGQNLVVDGGYTIW